MQAADLEILIPQLQGHIWKHDYKSYLQNKLPRDINDVRMNLVDLNIYEIRSKGV